MALVRQIIRLASRAVNHKGVVPMKAKQKPVEAIPPTPEQMAKVDYARHLESDSKGNFTAPPYRRVRQLDKLNNEGHFTPRQFNALTRYQQAADRLDRSCTKDSLNIIPKGAGGHHGANVALDAQGVVGDALRAAGSLAGMLEAVISNDMTLSQWAMTTWARKRDCKRDCKQVFKRDCKETCGWRPTERATKLAKIDLTVLAQRIEAAIGQGQGPGRILDDRIAA